MKHALHDAEVVSLIRVVLGEILEKIVVGSVCLHHPHTKFGAGMSNGVYGNKVSRDQNGLGHQIGRRRRGVAG